MTDIKDYSIEHEQQIIEDFVEAHETEFDEWVEGEECPRITQELINEWAQAHSGYMRFVELHYADYQSGGE
jgi:hypothetical protein